MWQYIESATALSDSVLQRALVQMFVYNKKKHLNEKKRCRDG